jgi:cellobiose phosphorylase
MHKYDNEQAPLRAELFSVEQMEQFARSLAKTHAITAENQPEQLLKRLADNEEILLEVHNLITESAKENVRISPAAEWLLDNFYLIEEQIYTGKKHLPKGYSKGLPQLSKGPSVGLPRVYDIALQLISHSDGRVDLYTLSRFISAYQEVTPLKLGELWAIPIMLRLSLIENLRRLAAQIAQDRINKNLADYWADQMTETAEKDPKNLIVVIADMAKYGPPLVSSFVAELSRRLSGKGASLALPLSWIEQRLSEKGLTSNELVYQENQKQAVDQVSISNSISGLRFLSTNDWRDFVEKHSLVEQVLAQDPLGIYPVMDFRTKDHYRHVVEKLAKYSLLSEQEIASKAIGLANEHPEKGDTLDRERHVGYYLLDKGRRRLEKHTHVYLPFLEVLIKLARSMALFLYLGFIFIVAGLLTFFLLTNAYNSGLANPWLLGALAIFSLIATSQLSISLVNWISTILVEPNVLPRMDFSKGIPEQYRTLVVIPTIFSNAKELNDLLENLEVRFLANRDAYLHFALLTDFPDAREETLAGEDELKLLARNKIVALNKQYGANQNELFFLFHRPRKWNAIDKMWMGYERKRGKLGELNALLLGRRTENDFSVIVGQEGIFQEFRYVITLDTDTQLPRDAAWHIVATMAHPLNHPCYNEKKHRVTQGYTILQPRVAVSLPFGESSLYARIHGNEPGIDPYTRAVSDVYQDLFREGSYIGKGIYDLRSFEKVLNDRFPENRILSHDLLEGSYARCGLLSDVQLYEEYPSNYHEDIKRRRRWVRGDWQIASWLLPYVPGHYKKLVKNPISALSRWKILDNLRRSLVAISMLLMLIYGWIFSSSAILWTLAVIIIIVLPSILTFSWELIRKPKDVLLWQHLLLSFRFALNNLLQHFFTFSFIPYEAFVNAKAIFVTNWRMIVTHKKLLQWNPFSNTKSRMTATLKAFYFRMWFAPFTAIATFVYLTYTAPLSLVVALPVLALWTLSPAFAWRISMLYEARKVELNDSQKRFLHQLSRKTWSFFEQFVTADDNWLPPDNFQESPVARTAHRTSPTNIGLALLANFSAYDFGYITPSELIERTSNTMNAMHGLERFRGHFFNWYDTQNLQYLNPKYISTVDSGNLACILMTLRQGFLGLLTEKIYAQNLFSGLHDTCCLVSENKDKNEAEKQFLVLVENLIKNPPESLTALFGALEQLNSKAGEIREAAKKDSENRSDEWSRKLLQHSAMAKSDLASLTPWITHKEIPSRFAELILSIDRIPTLKELSGQLSVVMDKLDEIFIGPDEHKELEWLSQFKKDIHDSSRRAKERILHIENLSRLCSEFSDYEYDFLYDKSQRLLAIGYNAIEHRRDQSYYDLLASEARMTTFVAIAQGKLPQDSWFALGRQLTNPGTSPVLLSWSGSMFEYLMPLIVMPTFENTLLDQTNKATVQKQIEYAKKRGVPWGISESGYNMVDASLNYQYRAFGVPGLGLKRGLGEDLVIAPYATVLALMVSPEEAYKNLAELVESGFEGQYGFFEAIDYTAARMPRGQSNVVVRSFMAHHQGMSLLSLAYLLLDKLMQKRFESEPQFKAIMLLLQERIPHATEFYSPSVHVADTPVETGEVQIRVLHTPHTPVPELQLLSNGRYHVMVTNSGGGYSRWKDIAVTRWREDGTSDDWGTFCYIRDLDGGHLWTTAFQPGLDQGENYEVVFSQGRAEFRRRDHNLETHSEIVVSSEDDVEMRRIHITNRSRKKRQLEITSYAEVVLTHPMADATHPAFNKLFVQTEINPQRQAILCTRRPRAQGDPAPWMFHLMKAHNAETKQISFETDRSRFIGRGHTVHDPKVFENLGPLSGTQGSVLDPVVAIQYRIIIDPHETATVDMVFGIAENKEICHSLIEKYQDRPLTDRAFELAWTHSQVVLRQINADESDAQLYAKLAGSVIFANPALRADNTVILKNRLRQSGLWSYAISGDLPIVLLRISDSSSMQLVRQLVQAHAYWRLKGLIVDLVIWNEDHGGYRQSLQDEILSLISPGIVSDIREKPGGIFIRMGDQISNEDRILFQTVARVVLSDSLGTLEEQISRSGKLKAIIPYITPTKFYATQAGGLKVPENLQFFNGRGGFREDGKEYVVINSALDPTPAPWINVLANPDFGSIVSETAQSYTWTENAHEMRLTPWSNDAVTDQSGEAFYIRDEESGKFWSPAPLPSPGKSNYICRHGFGYSVFEYLEDGIHSEMTVFVDRQEPVKFSVLKIRNSSGRPRRLTVTGYVEWVLGDLRFKTLMHVITESDTGSGAILAKNHYSTEFENRVAFFDTDEISRTYTTDRAEFLGRNGTLKDPEAMARIRLSGKWGAALDPCAAIQALAEMENGEEREIVFRLGAGKDPDDATRVIKQFKGSAAAANALQKVKDYWNRTLSRVRIKTPDSAFDILANGWLNYQTLASRLWGRSGYYQSGGAFGFRDQLQDVLSLLHCEPLLARKQIMLAASRQFREGDVQHWWHPPSGRGVRTTCSDDFLWLPFVVSHYVTQTGDSQVLEEIVPFIEGRLLNPGEESYYDLPVRSDQSASVYDHCIQAISRALHYGVHGLPLMGSGDWNDGMDKVGIHGQGESVWLAFFLYCTLVNFAGIAEMKKAHDHASQFRREAQKLKENIDKNAWDGEWYRRAYFDDGRPLGSNQNEECKIDSIAQSWSVISGAGDQIKSAKALNAAAKWLVRKDISIIQLFTPPFDKTDLNPGYIKGYVPGVRENGGQYTHGAIWLVMAYAMAGDQGRVWELLKMINPLYHARNTDEMARYKVEPYVIAADVYALSGFEGQGGWTWYTGSAGWMYQLIIEYFIGIKKQGNCLRFAPCIPLSWDKISISYSYMDTIYEITIHNQAENGNRTSLLVDGIDQPDGTIQLINDKQTHQVELRISPHSVPKPALVEKS